MTVESSLHLNVLVIEHWIHIFTHEIVHHIPGFSLFNYKANQQRTNTEIAAFQILQQLMTETQFRFKIRENASEKSPFSRTIFIAVV